MSRLGLGVSSGVFSEWAMDIDFESVALEQRRFNRLLVICLGITLFMGVVIPFIDVPEHSIESLEKDSQRYARVMITKQKMIPPPPQPAPKPQVQKEVEKPKLQPEKPVEKKTHTAKVEPKPVAPDLKPKATPPKPTTTEVHQAREKVKKLGVVGMNDILADMRQMAIEAPPVVDSAPRTMKKLSSMNTVAQQLTDSGALSQQAFSDSGGVVSSSGTHTVAANNMALAEHETSVAGLAPEPDSVKPKSKNEQAKKARVALRDEALIRRVFDQNKGAIDALYRRALRKDPTLQGRVTVEVLIEPSGAVAECKIVSSELDDEPLEQRLVARISMIEFGKKAVEPQRVQYSFDFVPS